MPSSPLRANSSLGLTRDVGLTRTRTALSRLTLTLQRYIFYFYFRFNPTSHFLSGVQCRRHLCARTTLARPPALNEGFVCVCLCHLRSLFSAGGVGSSCGRLWCCSGLVVCCVGLYLLCVCVCDLFVFFRCPMPSSPLRANSSLATTRCAASSRHSVSRPSPLTTTRATIWSTLAPWAHAASRSPTRGLIWCAMFIYICLSLSVCLSLYLSIYRSL